MWEILRRLKKVFSFISVYKNDLGLIGETKKSSKFESIPFLKEELILIISPGHPLSKKKKVSLKEIEGYPFYHPGKRFDHKKDIITGI